LYRLMFPAPPVQITPEVPGTLSGIATTKNSKSKGNGAGGVGGNRLIFRYYRPVSAEGGSYLSGLRIPLDSITDWRNT
ncbi:hypothetical protein, partial [Escherichia coli]|uniref:hypothetical protein n=1 Tax=Escherichia coli TaxID=562 RepID=UPI0019D12445